MKKAYIGRSGSGKTTKMLQDLVKAKNEQVIDENSTLVIILKGELETYKETLPNATYCICERDEFKCADGDFETLIVDSIFLDNERLSKLNITPKNQLPKNVFWTFQGGIDMQILFPNLEASVKENLLQIDRVVSKSSECFVVEVEK